MNLPWNKYIPNWPNQGNIKYGVTKIVIPTGGLYFVYCRLRVGKDISKVFIWKNDSVLFSSRPTFSNGSRNGVVQMFGLAEIAGGESVYVQVEFHKESEARKLLGSIKRLTKLFPDFNSNPVNSYNASSHVVPDRNINSFGAFKVS